MNFFSTWQFNIIGFLISVVLFFQFYKLAVKNATQDGAATVLLQLIAGITALLLSPLFPFHFPTAPQPYLLLCFACVFYALFDRIQTTVRKHLEVSVFSILNQFTTIFLILFGIIFFREPLVLTKLFGASLVLLGNFIVFYQPKGFNLNIYSFLGIISTLIFAIAISIDVGISSQFNLPFYIALTLITPALMLIIFERLSPTQIISEFTPQLKPFYLITGITWVLTIFFSLRAFRFGTVTTIAPLQATSVILNVFVAYLFLHERNHKLKKFIAALFVILGIYFTSHS